jgi:lysozyme family protein
MRQNFAAANALTRKDEGGNVDDPADRGGRTSRGVTQRTYDDFRTKKGQPKTDVYLMTEAECDEIYLTRYWIPTDCDQLAIGPDYAAYDYSVNSGPARGKAAGVAAHNLPPVDAVKAICAKRTSFVNAIKNFAKFRKGVLARVARVEAAGVKMALFASPTTSAIDTVIAIKAEKTLAANKAKIYNTKATGTTATAVPTVGAGAAVGPGDHWLDWGAIGLVAVLAVLLIAYFVYNVKKHEHRAKAYGEA